jgi:homoserine acetyltransferase
MRFPRYNYDDMVEAQYRLLTEHLGVRHLRLVLGNSMGGMETWIMAQKYPAFMDVAVPMASLPSEMAGRNWMTRRLIIDSIRNDPEWLNGNYTKQPRMAWSEMRRGRPRTVAGRSSRSGRVEPNGSPDSDQERWRTGSAWF